MLYVPKTILLHFFLDPSLMNLLVGVKSNILSEFGFQQTSYIALVKS